MDDLVARAFRAYFMTNAQEGGMAKEPIARKSSREEVDAKNYVVLRNRKGVLAVYRVRNDGMLKRLRRWPITLGEATGEGLL